MVHQGRALARQGRDVVAPLAAISKKFFWNYSGNRQGKKKVKKFWENPPKIPGFSKNFLHKIPGDRCRAPKGPQGGAKGRDHVATGRDMVATMSRPGRDPERTRKKKLFSCGN